MSNPVTFNNIITCFANSEYELGAKVTDNFWDFNKYSLVKSDEGLYSLEAQGFFRRIWNWISFRSSNLKKDLRKELSDRNFAIKDIKDDAQLNKIKSAVKYIPGRKAKRVQYEILTPNSQSSKEGSVDTVIADKSLNAEQSLRLSVDDKLIVDDNGSINKLKEALEEVLENEQLKDQLKENDSSKLGLIKSANVLAGIVLSNEDFKDNSKVLDPLLDLVAIAIKNCDDSNAELKKELVDKVSSLFEIVVASKDLKSDSNVIVNLIVALCKASPKDIEAKKCTIKDIIDNNETLKKEDTIINTLKSLEKYKVL